MIDHPLAGRAWPECPLGSAQDVGLSFRCDDRFTYADPPDPQPSVVCFDESPMQFRKMSFTTNALQSLP